MQKTGGIAYLRPRALTLSTDYFSPKIYGKGSEPAPFAEIALFGKVRANTLCATK